MPRWLKSQSLGAASDLYYNPTTFSQYYVCTYLHYTTFCSYEVPGPCMTGGTRVRYQVTTFLGTVNVDWEALSMHTDIRNCPMRCLENVKFRGVKLKKKRMIHGWYYKCAVINFTRISSYIWAEMTCISLIYTCIAT